MLKYRGTELYPQRILSSTFFLSGLFSAMSYLLNLAFLNKHTCYFSLNFNSKGKTLITFKLYYQKRTLPCPLRLRRDSQTNDQYKIERQNIDGSSLAMKSLWRLVWVMRHQSFHQFFLLLMFNFKETWRKIKHFRLLFFYFNLFEKISSHPVFVLIINIV